MADIDDLFIPPNEGAYEKEEVRKGPPLSYVGEKLRGSLYHLHWLCQTIRETVPDDLPAPPHVQAEPFSTN